jgi:hypothetical protein
MKYSNIIFAASVAFLACTTARAESLLDATRRANVPNCKIMGEVYHLDPNGDNNLSVRQSPSGRAGLAYEIDELYTGQEVCVTGIQGKWAHVFYIKNGDIGQGWVHSGYISVR